MAGNSTAADHGFALLSEFLSAGSVEELRRNHCAHCGRFDKAAVAQRACLMSRCQLHDNATFEMERQFIAACRPLLYNPDNAHLDEMNAFNWYLHSVGCVTPAMQSGPHGFWQMAVMGEGTIRGVLHAALFTFMAKQAGDYLPSNVRMTKQEMLDAWSQKRALREKDDAWHASWMSDAKFTLAQICEHLGRKGKPRDPDTVRKLIKRHGANRGE